VTTSTFQDFKKANKVVIIGYLSPDDHESYEAFTSLAKDMKDDFLFGMTSDQSLIQTEKVKIPSLVVYKNFDEEKRIFHSMDDCTSMAAFVKESARPLIVEFLPELHEGYFNVWFCISSFFKYIY
jgi:protein disulfide-isomerase A1